MNPDYSASFRAMSQLSQSMDGVLDRLNIKRQSHQAACGGKIRQKLTDNVFEARRRVNYTQSKIDELMKELRVHQAAVVQHSQTLADWYASQPGLKSELKVFEDEYFGTMAVQGREIEVMRVWGKRVQFADLSDELLVMVLGCVDYVDQQRLTRVCHRWQHVIATDIDHVYLDWPAVPLRRRLGDYRIFHEHYTHNNHQRHFVDNIKPRIYRWQAPSHKLSVIRRLTFHAGFGKIFQQALADLVPFAQQYPNLTVVTFSKLRLEGLANLTVVCGFVDYWKQLPDLQVKIVDSAVWAFSDGINSEAYPVSDRWRPSLDHPALANRADSYVPVADTVLLDRAQLRDFLLDVRLTWPYPVQQIVWLKQYAPCLNENLDAIFAVKALSAGLDKELLCPLHTLLCSHLEQSFYENMPGPGRNLIALLLLKLKPATVPPPPMAFSFQRLISKGKRIVVASVVR